MNIFAMIGSILGTVIFGGILIAIPFVLAAETGFGLGNTGFVYGIIISGIIVPLLFKIPDFLDAREHAKAVLANPDLYKPKRSRLTDSNSEFIRVKKNLDEHVDEFKHKIAKAANRNNNAKAARWRCSLKDYMVEYEYILYDNNSINQDTQYDDLRRLC